MRTKSFLIGIGGVSRSGKSTLALDLKKYYSQSGKSVIIIEQDKQVVPEEKIPGVRDRLDWEHPDSIDWQKLRSLILREDHCDIKITEGIFAFCNPDLNDHFDVKIFIDIPRETFLLRKIRDKRWGIEPEWYIRHIWRSYLKFGRCDDADLKLNGEKPFDLNEICRQLNPFFEDF